MLNFNSYSIAFIVFQAIELPAATYPLFDSIPLQVISSGLLSSLQLEGILYAVSCLHELFIKLQTPETIDELLLLIFV